MNDENVIYVCLKLDLESRGELRELVCEMFNDEYCRLLCDHLTLAYGPEVRDFDESLIGMWWSFWRRSSQTLSSGLDLMTSMTSGALEWTSTRWRTTKEEEDEDEEE